MSRQEIIQPISGSHNVQSDLAGHKSIPWEEIEKHFSWHETGQVNMAYECVDRHVDNGFGNKTALHYVEGENEWVLTYSELKEETDRWAQVLKENGVKKGDFLFVFLPKHPECHIAILAAIKLGVIVGPLFEAFMEEAVRDRISDCEGKYLITNEEYLQRVPVADLPSLEAIFLTDDQPTSSGVISIPQALSLVETSKDIIEWMDLDDGLNIHYTSGSTGKPKGVIHAHRAMIQQFITGRWVLDIKEEDVYWCTAHPGWVTGCVYGIFAPLLNRATVVIHGGRFHADSWYETIEKTGVTVWYSAPTAFRMLMAAGNEALGRHDLSKLRHILSVGEPLNPEVIYWALENLNLRIHDTWWMTETGAQLIVNLPTEAIKPGSMGKPLPNIETAILDDEGNILPLGEVGHLAIKGPWPAIMKGIWKNEAKYASYFPFGPEWYLAGDLASKDEEGYIFFQGRSDDMINSSGERIGPFEVESKLIEHPAVAEAGVIGKPDSIRGEIVKAFIVLNKGYYSSPTLLENIRLFVRGRLAAHSAPREIEVVEELPKTKISGKILRRELKAKEIEKLTFIQV